MATITAAIGPALAAGAAASSVLLAQTPLVPASSHTPTIWSSEANRAVVNDYCITCHDDELMTGGMSLQWFDVESPEVDAELAEKMVRKLRAGMMPPPEAERPPESSLLALATWLENRLDAVAAEKSNPGRRTFQRLNRAEYANSVKALLDLEVDVAAFLPPDTISRGFDNIADVQAFSPTLLEGYLRAAGRISREAVGDPDSGPGETTYKVPRTASQLERVPGAPFGTRGGISVLHNFPADGEYVFKILLHGTPTGQLFGGTTLGEQLEISVNGSRAALLEIHPHLDESDPNGLRLETGPVAIKTGPQRISAAFVQRAVGPVDDVIAPIEHTLADTQIGSAWGITTLPHLRDLTISGPYNVTGVSDTPSRRAIFVCRPVSADDEKPCARRILERLATQAYRRPVEARELASLLEFFERGSTDGGFEGGVRTALQAILASPHFVFRLEPQPAAVEGDSYRIGGIELASRLSYFLWAAPPDDELLAAAQAGVLRNPEVLRQQVRRMLADPRSEALATRFAAQWLRLQDLEGMHPDALIYPQYDYTLGQSMRRETELFFHNLLQNDRSALELLTADYTFVDERLAAHYGIAGVAGPTFRRVQLPDERRRGLLGHGSILTLTSIPDRTSPVIRGKWIMEVLLGTPPPPPPPNVPDLEETRAVEGSRLLSVRERMAEHRDNPSCNSCHRVIDPLGLALENFDPTGAWRIKDNGALIDPRGELYDGTPLNGPASLRRALLNRSDVFITSFTESLLTYGLGRRVEYFDMPAVRAITRAAAAADNRLSAFVLGVVSSDAFQMSRIDKDPVTSGSGGLR